MTTETTRVVPGGAGEGGAGGGSGGGGEEVGGLGTGGGGDGLDDGGGKEQSALRVQTFPAMPHMPAPSTYSVPQRSLYVCVLL